LPHAAATQAPLHDNLSGPRVKGSRPINWTPELQKAFDACKASLSHATLLAHPDPSAPHALVTDASISAKGAILQQRVGNDWQPLAFFSKKLNQAQQKYSSYERELLTVYETVKHFRHMLGTLHFMIFTDHKPITFAFQQKRDTCSEQFNQLDFIAQFTIDIRHISGQDNVVADALSRVKSVTKPPSHDEIAATQDNATTFGQTLLATNTALRLERLQVPGTAVSLYCDISTGKPRRMSLLLYASACSGPSMICRTPASRRIVVPGQELVQPAGVPKSPATRPRPWEIRTTACPFPSHPYRPDRSPSYISGLHLLPHGS
jgi:cleavage and polyadenylation specificity factor subunit 1